MPYSAAVSQATSKAQAGQIELPADRFKVGSALGHHLVNNIKDKCSICTLYKGKEHCQPVDIIDIDFITAERHQQ